MTRLAALVIALALGLAGCGSPSAPTAAPPAAGPSASTPDAVAVPTRIEIPTIGVGGDLVGLGLAPDGTLEVPSVDQPLVPAWYTGSPRPGMVGQPGAPGSAVITGHVDGRIDGRSGQPGIFYRLRELRAGDSVFVVREDGSRAEFEVSATPVRVPKGSFPTMDVYGPVTRPRLVLITCGGVFDRSEGHYQDNWITYADLIA